MLPERSFRHPVAQALIALRRSLSVAPEDRSAARGTRPHHRRPFGLRGPFGTYLVLRVARARILRDLRPAAVEEVQQLLWETALALEEGRDTRTARALAEAREALHAGPGRGRAHPDAEARAEIDRRIQALREAIRRHLEALAERLRRGTPNACRSIRRRG